MEELVAFWKKEISLFFNEPFENLIRRKKSHPAKSIYVYMMYISTGLTITELSKLIKIERSNIHHILNKFEEGSYLTGFIKIKTEYWKKEWKYIIKTNELVKVI
jgi:hypothetical protein